MPENEQIKTRRIAKNTILLYIRSLLSLFISLYTSRLILKGLGVDDYGIYGVVGGFVSMFSIVTGSLRSAISRFYNYALGKGEEKGLSNIFALSLNIMLILSVIVILLTETFGLWFLYNRMTIPPDRLHAAFWCFQFSILSSVSGFLVVPFAASMVAHEKMGVFSYIDIFEVVLKFFIALLITFSIGHIDKLITYAALLLAVTLAKQMISRIYAMRHFEECKIRWFWDKKSFIEMFSYAGWNFLGTTSSTFAGEGVNMVVNVVFGPAVNAARSLSWTVIHTTQIFVNNFTTAIWPQVAQSYASGDHTYMKQLILRGAKFSYFIMWMVELPLFLETEFVLGLWLGDYPAHTVNFIRLALIYNLTATLHVVFGMGIKASGKIKWMQICFSILDFLIFGISYFLLHNGFAPEWCYICSLFASLLQILVMWILSKIQLDFSISEQIRSVMIPSLIVSSISCIFPILIFLFMPYGWPRFLSVLTISILSSVVCILYIGCSPTERNLLISMVKSRIRGKTYGNM